MGASIGTVVHIPCSPTFKKNFWKDESSGFLQWIDYTFLFSFRGKNGNWRYSCTLFYFSYLELEEWLRFSVGLMSSQYRYVIFFFFCFSVLIVLLFIGRRGDVFTTFCIHLLAIFPV